MWVNRYFRDYNGTQHVIMDGMPRKLHEAGVVNSCLEFYGFQKPWVINIDISNEESRKRLLARKRVDDNDGEITRRLAWYETDVEPTIEYYDGNPKYNFLKIPGERTIEEIHADIVKRLGLV
jgi:adenylate kinase family enzyme